MDGPDRPDVAVVGTVNLDRTVRVPRLPVLGESVVGDDVVVGPGGKGANQAIAAARQGARTALIGCVGDDDAADVLLAYLAAVPDLDAEAVTRVAGATGSAAITVDPHGGNTVVSAPGANRALDEVTVHRWGTKIGGAKVLLVQLGFPLEGVRAALEIARSVGTITVLDPAPPDGITDELLRLADVVIPNETEAARLSAIPVDTVEDAARAAAALLRRGAASVVITRAERGALWCPADGDPVVVAPHTVDAVDPTGAGDAFAGTLAAALSRGVPMGEALLDAVAAGALSVTRVGAAPALPTRSEVVALRR